MFDHFSKNMNDNLKIFYAHIISGLVKKFTLFKL